MHITLPGTVTSESLSVANSKRDYSKQYRKRIIQDLLKTTCQL